MPDLKTPTELAAVLGDVAAFTDPLAELQKRGFRFTGELASVLHNNASHKPLPARLVGKFQANAAKVGKVRVRVGAPPSAAPRFAPTDYDVVAAVRLSVVDQVLHGLYDTFTIPHNLALRSLLQSTQLQALDAIVKGAMKGIPDDAQVQNLRIAAAPTVAEVAGTGLLFLKIPFELDFRGEQPDAGTTTLSGTLTLVAQVTADVKIRQPVATKSTLTFAITLPADPQPAHPSLAVNPASPVQPLSAQAAANLASVLQTVLSGILNKSFVISPIITIPVTSALSINVIVERVDVRTNSSPAGGLVLAGIRFAGAGSTPPDPQLLLTFFPQPAQNIFVRVDQRYLQSLLDQAKQNGTLAKALSDASDADISVSDVRVEFAPAVLRIIVSGTKADACFFKDVSFTVTLSIKIELRGDQIVLTPTTDISTPTLDKVECLLIAGLTSLLIAIPAAAVNPVLGIFFGVLVTGMIALGFDGGSAGGGGSNTKIIDLNTPVPNTELLPTLNSLVSAAGDGVLSASATAGFRPDTINTYIYARFLGTIGAPIFASPLKSATIQLVDQDVPAPPGDDAAIPATGEHERITPKFIITETTTFQPPTEDQVLGSATTDFDGRVMFVLSGGGVSSAGTVTKTTTTERVGGGGHHNPNDPGGPGDDGTQVKVDTETLVEQAPDLYFHVLAAGVNTDTRKLPNGFFLNFNQKRLGTPAAPVTYTVRVQLVAHA